MIPLYDFKREYGAIGKQVLQAVQRVLVSGNFVLGENVAILEEEFSKFIGTRFGIGVNFGSDALFMAVKALGIGHGDEVLTVSHTMISTVDAISRNGAKPVFVDIEPDSCNMDTTKIESKITRKTRAIIPVHLYGNPAEMKLINEVARKHGLYVIEDCCQAHGCEYKNVRVGNLSDIGCFSFYPTKNVGACGDGGMLVTNKEEIASNLKQMRNYGQSKRYYYDFVGLNSRLDELQASILRVKLGFLQQWNERRRKIAKLYTELLSDYDLALPQEKDYARHVYHLYVIKSKRRNDLQQHLLNRGIQTLIHYPVPVHLQKAYSTKDKLPITEKICGEILSLPMNPWLRDSEVAFIAETVGEHSKT